MGGELSGSRFKHSLQTIKPPHLNQLTEFVLFYSCLSATIQYVAYALWGCDVRNGAGTDTGSARQLAKSALWFV